MGRRLLEGLMVSDAKVVHLQQKERTMQREKIAQPFWTFFF